MLPNGNQWYRIGVMAVCNTGEVAGVGYAPVCRDLSTLMVWRDLVEQETEEIIRMIPLYDTATLTITTEWDVQTMDGEHLFEVEQILLTFRLGDGRLLQWDITAYNQKVDHGEEGR